MLTPIARQMAETGQTEQVALRSLQSRKRVQELERMKRASVLRHVERRNHD